MIKKNTITKKKKKRKFTRKRLKKSKKGLKNAISAPPEKGPEKGPKRPKKAIFGGGSKKGVTITHLAGNPADKLSYFFGGEAT